MKYSHGVNNTRSSSRENQRRQEANLMTSAASAVAAGQRVELPEEIITKMLDIYRPEHRYIRSAIICGSSLECSLGSTEYPYTREPLFDYITAPTATLFACQLAYVLVGGMVVMNHPLVNLIKSLDEFRDNRDCALLRFAKINLCFRSEVENKWPIACSMCVRKSKSYLGSIHCNMVFAIGGGISGTIHGVLIGG